jgi:serine/threonine protein phosphatase PrpC
MSQWSAMFDVVQRVEAYGSRGQDRVDVVEHSRGTVIVVADGAGGTAGGAEAAEAVVDVVRLHADGLTDIRPATQWVSLLMRIDRDLSASIDGGQTTAVIVALSDDGLAGASVGDSSAWIIHDSGYADVTACQVRKPLLGSGMATVVPFELNQVLAGTLLVASDGLIKYAPAGRICETARGDLREAAARLIDLVRLRSGALQDDVAMVLGRRR